MNIYEQARAGCGNEHICFPNGKPYDHTCKDWVPPTAAAPVDKRRPDHTTAPTRPETAISLEKAPSRPASGKTALMAGKAGSGDETGAEAVLGAETARGQGGAYPPVDGMNKAQLKLSGLTNKRHRTEQCRIDK